ncbi:MAG: S8 family serine peptidase [Lewinellaceae bacterium]|nr:S8 family serine peptidase [Lewinellaceae bacterium]
MLCPICHQNNGPLVHHFHGIQDEPVITALEQEAPGWQPAAGACTRCVDQAQLSRWAAVEDGDKEPLGAVVSNYWILPIPKRLTAHPAYQGGGVTICFIDSGFYPHPDLCYPENRILKMIDIHRPGKDIAGEWAVPHPQSWHGTMTSVVGAGAGTLSDGIYRSLAPKARLVLIKVMDEEGSISSISITAALKWVARHHEKYGIRIVNLSVSDDWAAPYRESEVDLAIEQLVMLGINVVAAAGNDTGSQVRAPANSPHAITVGGLDDANTLHPLAHSLYHSTYGTTADYTFKPELIAPAIWLPAPLLPGTAEQREAGALFAIRNAPERYRKAVAANLLYRTSLSRGLLSEPLARLDEAVAKRIEAAKFITPHYQHSDGTSFAAPIVCSVIAQMLEANPELDPADIREILLRTARKLPGFQEQRQGFGVVHPLSAVYHAEQDHHRFPPYFNPVIDYEKRTIRFHCHDEAARRVMVSGSFNGWQESALPLMKTDDHLWEGATIAFPKGKYTYKFLIDGKEWRSDMRNLFREPDGLGGFNSLIFIES